MQLEGKTNYHNIFEPTFLMIETQDGQTIYFQPWNVNRWFKHQLIDFPDLEEVKTYKLSSWDGKISFHYIIHPGIQAIVIPPNSIEMDFEKRNNGISNEIQDFFETMAYKHWYRLIVGITPESAAAFNQRIYKILRNVWYYMWPPSTQASVYFWEHQYTYMGDGIPEIGTEPEYMIPPTIH